jgi:hypothetical protein
LCGGSLPQEKQKQSQLFFSSKHHFAAVLTESIQDSNKEMNRGV